MISTPTTSIFLLLVAVLLSEVAEKIVTLGIMLFTTKTYTFFGDSLATLQNVISDEKSVKTESENEVKGFLEKNCKPKHNILFMKTHKTGSTSVQNILFRYGDTHNLTFILPKSNNYFGHPEFFNRGMLYSDPRLANHTQNLSSIQNNIFAQHARYNYEEMKSIMPVDTLFVTILRDPVSVIESLFSYYNLKNIYHENSTIDFLEKFFSSPSNVSGYHVSFHERLYNRFGSNQMSFDLGLDMQDFNHSERIREFIKTIDSQFHLVMIADRMEESLILLQQLLCWTRDDMITFRHNVRILDLPHHLPIPLQTKIRYFNKADELLYKYFSDKLTYHTKVFGMTEMQKQIISLRHATKLMYRKCVKKEVPMTDLGLPKFIWSTRLVLGFKIQNNTDKICEDLTTPELLYIELLKKKQGLENSVSGVYTNSTNVKV